LKETETITLSAKFVSNNTQYQSAN